MKKSYSKIRHIQEANAILEKRILREQTQVAPQPINSVEPVVQDQNQPPVPQPNNVPPKPKVNQPQLRNCQEFMQSTGQPGASSFLNINGNVTIEDRATVAPEFQGYYINVNNKPYCFIPKK